MLSVAWGGGNQAERKKGLVLDSETPQRIPREGRVSPTADPGVDQTTVRTQVQRDPLRLVVVPCGQGVGHLACAQPLSKARPKRR